MAKVGSIVFGPLNRDLDKSDWARAATSFLSAKMPVSEVRACNCIGPQAGETKCPCRLLAESEQGRLMIRDGITIDGVEYELKRKAGA